MTIGTTTTAITLRIVRDRRWTIITSAGTTRFRTAGEAGVTLGVTSTGTDIRIGLLDRIAVSSDMANWPMPSPQAIMGDDLVGAALKWLVDIPPRDRDRVLRRGEMIEAILNERLARLDVRNAAAGVTAGRCGAAGMNGVPAAPDGDLVGLSVTGTIGDRPDLFANDEPRVALTQPGVRIWHAQLRIGGRSRQLVLAEPLADPGLEMLLRAVRNCFRTRRLMAIEENPPWLIDPVAVAEPRPESVALNHLMDG